MPCLGKHDDGVGCCKILGPFLIDDLDRPFLSCLQFLRNRVIMHTQGPAFAFNTF